MSSGAETFKAWRQERGLGLRAAGRVCGVTHPTVARWEAGGTPVPAAVLATLPTLGPDPRSTREVVLRLVGDTPGITPARVCRLTGIDGPEVLEELRHQGAVVRRSALRVDTLGRRYSPSGLYVSSGIPPAHLDPEPVPTGKWMRERRAEKNLTVPQLAEELGVQPGTIRVWENEHQDIPAARAGDARRVLKLNGADIRSARTEAGWSLRQFAEIAGAPLSQVSHWERRDKKIPATRIQVVGAAVRQAREAARRSSPRQRKLDSLVGWVQDHPGQTPGVVLHHHHRRWDGLERSLLEDALRDGRIVKVYSPTPHQRESGLPRRLHRCYVPGDVPATEDELSGSELKAERLSRGLSQSDVARIAGVSQSVIGRWELRDRAPVPPWRVPTLRAALGTATPRAAASRVGRGLRPSPVATNAVRARLAAEIREAPGVSRYRLFNRVGHGQVVRAELEALINRGEVVDAPTPDALGRLYPGLWPAAVPRPALTVLTAPELRSVRTAAGLTQATVAARVGVNPSKVSQWETGARRISPMRSEQLRDALARGAAQGTRQDKALAALLEQASVPGGVTKTELHLKRRSGWAAALEAALAEGTLHWERQIRPLVDGRRPTVRVLLPGPAEPADESALSGKQLVALMAEGGVSQSELGRRLGVTQSAVWRWQRTVVPAGRVGDVLTALGRPGGNS